MYGTYNIECESAHPFTPNPHVDSIKINQKMNMKTNLTMIISSSLQCYLAWSYLSYSLLVINDVDEGISNNPNATTSISTVSNCKLLLIFMKKRLLRLCKSHVIKVDKNKRFRYKSYAFHKSFDM